MITAWVYMLAILGMWFPDLAVAFARLAELVHGEREVARGWW